MDTLYVVFGATGDLMKKKLFPSFSNIFNENKNLKVLGIGRKDFDDKSFRDFNYDFLNKEISNLDSNFINSIFYEKLDYSKTQDYINLQKRINEFKEKSKDFQVIFYLALPPHLFETVMNNLKEFNLNSINLYNSKIVFEKPFGEDLKSAKDLNEKIRNVFQEKQVFRIDHYLGKGPIQNFLALRFANSFFEPLWNNKYIDNVQITGFETLGIEGRGEYYEKSGALKDMLQNHLLQMLSLIAMESPTSLDAKHIRDEKVKLFESITHLEEDFSKHIIIAQYDKGLIDNQKVIGYLDEVGIAKNSKTETYVALRIFIDNWRWKGVPFYLRTGKRMNKKGTTVVVEFKQLPNILFNKFGDVESNKLIIHIQPDASISIEFNVKSPTTPNKVERVISEFDHKDFFGINSPQAYEVLFKEIIKGDQTLFSRSDEVEESWRIVDKIVNCKSNLKISKYKSGTIGPIESDKLLKEDGRQWNNF